MSEYRLQPLRKQISQQRRAISCTQTRLNVQLQDWSDCNDGDWNNRSHFSGRTPVTLGCAGIIFSRLEALTVARLRGRRYVSGVGFNYSRVHQVIGNDGGDLSEGRTELENWEEMDSCNERQQPR